MPTWLKKNVNADLNNNSNNTEDSSGPLSVRERRRKKQYVTLLPLLCVLTFIVIGFSTNLIPSRSMEPTLMPGDHVVVMRGWLAFPFGRIPLRGEIITFHPPKSADLDTDDDSGGDGTASAADAEDPQPVSQVSLPRKPKREILIKRVIALPGETVQVIDGVVNINGKPIHEDYHTQAADDSKGYAYPYAVYEPLTVPPGHVFVLGDNRSNSDDGRFWGTLDCKDIVGKYVGVLFHEKEIAEAEDAAPTR